MVEFLRGLPCFVNVLLSLKFRFFFFFVFWDTIPVVQLRLKGRCRLDTCRTASLTRCVKLMGSCGL